MGLIYAYKRTRLGSAFKHRRMAENLLSNNIEFNNQMFLPEDEDDSDIIVMRDASSRNNFSNPVYESMYNNTEQNALVQQEQPVNPEEDPEAVDLLTERHRGNISL